MSKGTQRAVVSDQTAELNLRQIETVAPTVRPSTLRNVVKKVSSMFNFGDMTSSV